MIEQLKELIFSAQKCVVFTGAGVSTLSGIRDFRGKGGFYTSSYQGYQVEELLSLPLFYKNPSLFYTWAKEFIYVLDDFEPSVVHTVLATMEKRGLVEAVFTQNIDLLHQKGGSQALYELHGSAAKHHCLSCNNEATYEEVAPIVMGGEVPLCSKCNGVLKPDIVFYGEQLDQNLLAKAEKMMSEADLVLVLGSSLTVQPVASLPMATVYNGNKLVIVNAQPTPLDSFATLTLTDLKTTFEELERWL